jgi:hypothetical protein
VSSKQIGQTNGWGLEGFTGFDVARCVTLLEVDGDLGEEDLEPEASARSLDVARVGRRVGVT